MQPVYRLLSLSIYPQHAAGSGNDMRQVQAQSYLPPQALLLESTAMKFDGRLTKSVDRQL